MKTIELTLYKFYELNAEIQSKLLQEYREVLPYFDDGVLEDCVDLLEQLGFSRITIDYSLDYSHVPYAKVLGKFSTKDLTFAKDNHESIDTIVEMIENLGIVENSDIDLDIRFDDIMELLNAVIFEKIENDYINHYSNDSMYDNIVSYDCDYSINGNIFDESSF